MIFKRILQCIYGVILLMPTFYFAENIKIHPYWFQLTLEIIGGIVIGFFLLMFAGLGLWIIRDALSSDSEIIT
jgi:hypothetical protein